MSVAGLLGQPAWRGTKGLDLVKAPRRHTIFPFPKAFNNSAKSVGCYTG